MMSRERLLADPERPLTPKEVASLFRVDPKTVTRWHRSGRLREVRTIKTPGGHRRFRAGDIQRLLESNVDE